jgi:hypothetical protein
MKIYFSVLITFLLFKSFHLVSLNSLNSHDDEISFGENVVHWDFGSYIRPENKSVKFGLVIFSPKRPGTYPVIIFNSGFDGLVINELLVLFF